MRLSKCVYTDICDKSGNTNELLDRHCRAKRLDPYASFDLWCIANVHVRAPSAEVPSTEAMEFVKRKGMVAPIVADLFNAIPARV